MYFIEAKCFRRALTTSPGWPVLPLSPGDPRTPFDQTHTITLEQRPSSYTECHFFVWYFQSFYRHWTENIKPYWQPSKGFTLWPEAPFSPFRPLGPLSPCEREDDLSTLEAKLQSGLCIRTMYYLLASKSSHALFSFDSFFTLWDASRPVSGSVQQRQPRNCSMKPLTLGPGSPACP